MAKSEETKSQLATVIYNMLESVRVCALFFEPFMPITSKTVYESLGQGNIEEIEDIEQASN